MNDVHSLLEVVTLELEAFRNSRRTVHLLHAERALEDLKAAILSESLNGQNCEAKDAQPPSIGL